MRATGPLVLLVPGFPKSESDSTCLPALQSYVEALCRRVPQESIDVIAFQYPDVSRTYMWRGIRVHALGGQNSRVGKPWTWWKAVRRIRRVVSAARSEQRGVFHSFWFGECALVGEIMAALCGWAHVVSVGGREVRSASRYTFLLRGRRFQMTAGSHHAAVAVRNSLGRSVDATIPLGLDIDRVESLRSRRPREIDVLAVGSLIPLKRFDVVVNVAALLATGHPALRVAIVGEGPERPRLESMIAEAGLEQKVTLIGLLPRDHVLRLMHNSRVLLHPADYESQGDVFLEALACAMHVVCRDTGYLPNTPRVARCSTTAEMADAVERFLIQPYDGVPARVPTSDETVDAFQEVFARALTITPRRRHRFVTT